MTYLKLGCNWGTGNPDFYTLLKRESIVIYNSYECKMECGDIVAICKGFRVVAVAKIVSNPYPCTENVKWEKEFSNYNIEYEDYVYVCPSVIYQLNPDEQFEYRERAGIRKIKKMKL